MPYPRELLCTGYFLSLLSGELAERPTDREATAVANHVRRRRARGSRGGRCRRRPRPPLLRAQYEGRPPFTDHARRR
jgi:hypothetical protein